MKEFEERIVEELLKTKDKEIESLRRITGIPHIQYIAGYSIDEVLNIIKFAVEKGYENKKPFLDRA